jgi:hypothetical protein
MPLGVEYGAVFVLEGPDGTRAVFNDPSDEDFVGMLSAESSGLDSAEVREDLRTRADGDGATAGDFFYGPRPVILQGTVLSSSGGAPSKAERAENIAKIKRASNCMRADGTLTWKDAGLEGDETFLKVRRQQPVRFSKGYVKDFMIPLVAPYPYIRGEDSSDSVSLVSQLQSVKSFPSIQTVIKPGNYGPGEHGEGSWSPGTSGIEAQDGTYTKSALLANPAKMLFLMASGFNFAAIPNTAELVAITVGIHRRSNGATWFVRDYKVHLITSSSGVIGSNMADTVALWPDGSAAKTNVYGGEDLWGAALTPANVKKAGANEFGVGLVAEHPGTWPAEARAEVDAMWMEIMYELASAPQAVAEIVNNGDSVAPARITLSSGALGITDPKIINLTTGEAIQFDGHIPPEREIEIDTYNATVRDAVSGDNYYHMIDFAETEWFGIAPGANEIAIEAYQASGDAEMTVECDDTYV